MRKVIAAMNMTLDGFCDHTAGIADEEIHQHYSELLKTADTILYGRITYELMEYWRPIVEKPTGVKEIDEFAVTIDQIRKVVFSHTLKNLDWETATLATRELEEEVSALKEGNGRILVGSPGLIIALMKLNLIDELQLCIHPVIFATGRKLLFQEMTDRIDLTLSKAKTFGCGAVLLCYNLGQNR